MMVLRALRGCAPGLAVLLVAGEAAAQDANLQCQARGSQEWLSTRPSPLDSVTFRVGDTALKLCYSRPHARGRVVFDSLVQYDKVWRTGANEPTTLLLSGPAEVAGVRLAAGRYVIMSVPRPNNWVILFYTTPANEPAEMFQSLSEVGRGFAAAEPIDAPVEQFTMRATDGPTSHELVWEWEKVRVRLPVRMGR